MILDVFQLGVTRTFMKLFYQVYKPKIACTNVVPQNACECTTVGRLKSDGTFMTIVFAKKT